ncbi:MAG: type II toxin-antitoxin system HicB family antitoxin [Thiomargarita sp.]|nr:type II toxin-antitoxin system HicB family antitoxin [Thiomargarita sp.]
MMNLIEINGVKAFIQYDPDIDMLRGEFIGLNGSVDFYVDNIKTLKKEGEISLKVFMDMCKEDGVEPYKKFSGEFNIQIDPKLHEKIVAISKSQMINLNDFVNEAIENKLMNTS